VPLLDDLGYDTGNTMDIIQSALDAEWLRVDAEEPEEEVTDGSDE
jgi:hypothetical protein